MLLFYIGQPNQSWDEESGHHAVAPILVSLHLSVSLDCILASDRSSFFLFFPLRRGADGFIFCTIYCMLMKFRNYDIDIEVWTTSAKDLDMLACLTPTRLELTYDPAYHRIVADGTPPHEQWRKNPVDCFWKGLILPNMLGIIHILRLYVHM